jgi:hypothetical protein
MVYILVVCKVLCARKVAVCQLFENVCQIVCQKLVNAILIVIIGLSHFFLSVCQWTTFFIEFPIKTFLKKGIKNY